MRSSSRISAPLLLLFISAVICDDSSCLKGLKSSLQEQGGKDQKFTQWTPSMLAKPCDSTKMSEAAGITCSNNRVVSITLGSSGLSGTLSPLLADCTNLQTLDFSSNLLSGPIPLSIGNLTNLVSLNLSSNMLSGPIPLEISACQYLSFLDLHSNQLSGPIPGQLGLLQKLRFLDVTHNKLSGQIPTNLGSRFNASSFIGNKGLFGYPLPPPPSHSLTVPEIVGIGLGSGLFSLIVSFMAVCIWLRVSEQGYAAQEGKITQLVSE